MTSTPNYKTNVGRLATDRFDFQDHIDGYTFRHNASAIDISPSITVNGTSYTNLYTVLNSLDSTLSALITDATSSTKGIIKLSGDLSGTANGPTVVGLQGRTVSSTAPTNGQVLTWNTSSSSWIPSSLSGFTAGGDLSGSSVSQTVVSLTGSGGLTTIKSHNLTWAEDKIPTLNQSDNTTTHGKALIITAQGTSSSNKNGGTLLLSGGVKNGTGLKGGVALMLNGTSEYMVQISEIASSRRVLSLLKGTIASTSAMPSNTGDKVIYIADAATAPSTGNPVGGAILYSYNGELRTKTQSGDDFALGSFSNPINWAENENTLRRITNVTDSTATNTVVDLYTYTVPDGSMAYIKATVIGKETGSQNCVAYTLAYGASKDGGSAINLGTATTIDARDYNAGTWTDPTIELSGNDLIVKSGAKTATIIEWFAIIELDLVAA
jgi:hypothetical protein